MLGLSAVSNHLLAAQFSTPSKSHTSGTSVNMIIGQNTKAALPREGSGWQCQAVLPAVRPGSLISEV